MAALNPEMSSSKTSVASGLRSACVRISQPVCFHGRQGLTGTISSSAVAKLMISVLRVSRSARIKAVSPGKIAAWKCISETL